MDATLEKRQITEIYFFFKHFCPFTTSIHSLCHDYLGQLRSLHFPTNTGLKRAQNPSLYMI